MIRIPRFKPSEERKYIFNFPIFNYFGEMTAHVFARVSMTLQKFILSLVETCFYRLSRCTDFRDISKHILYECAWIYIMSNNDNVLRRLRWLARNRPKAVSKFVYYYVLHNLPENKQVYIMVCLEALNHRSPSHLSDFGGKGRTFIKRVDTLFLAKGRNIVETRSRVYMRTETLNLFGASIALRCKRFKNFF